MGLALLREEAQRTRSALKRSIGKVSARQLEESFVFALRLHMQPQATGDEFRKKALPGFSVKEHSPRRTERGTAVTKWERVFYHEGAS
jgi:hypothetical protein